MESVRRTKNRHLNVVSAIAINFKLNNHFDDFDAQKCNKGKASTKDHP